MAFMRPEIVHGGYWWVETWGGNFLVPDDCESEGTPETLAKYMPEAVGMVTGPRFHMEEWTITHRTGWYGRLSAPGYLDSTDWSPYDSEEEAIADLTDDGTDPDYDPESDDEDSADIGADSIPDGWDEV